MIIDARGVDDALNKTVDHAIERCTAVVVRCNGHVLLMVIPDVVLLELLANGTPLVGGMAMYRPDGRSVRVISPAAVGQSG